MRHLASLALLCLVLGVGCDSPPAQPPDASTGEQPDGGDAGADGSESPPDRSTEPPADGGEEPPPTDDPNQKFEIVQGEDACETDADCVKGACCHPNTCVGKDKAPSCGDVACTLSCEAGTTDCYGGCLCQEGKCAAKLWMGAKDGSTAGPS